MTVAATNQISFLVLERLSRLLPTTAPCWQNISLSSEGVDSR